MTIRLVAVLLVTAVACKKDAPSRPSDESQEPVAEVARDDGAAASPPDAAAADTTSQQSRELPPVPPELASAPLWVYRSLVTGGVMPREMLSHTTYRLRFVNGQAVLEIDKRSVQIEKRLIRASGPERWGPPTTTRLLGSAEDDGRRVALSFEGFNFDCRRRRKKVAGADAGRVPDYPRSEDSCGNKGRWQPSKTTKVIALDCSDAADRSMVFGREPGIEEVYVNDDCDQQGTGLRLVPADSSIRPARGKSDR